MNQAINRNELTQFGNMELLAKQVVEGFITGLHKSPFHGFSVEFAEHRIYNKGESTKHIDWKLYARSDKMFTKKYEEETNLRCQIVIDCSGSMYFPKDKTQNKLHFSIYAAASLIELLKKQRDAFGISLFDENLFLHSPTKTSVTHQRYIYSELEKHLNKNNDKIHQTNAIQSIHDVAELTHQRSLIVLFTDFFDDPNKTEELFQALQHLKHRKHEIIIFHVLDVKNEMSFELENRPYQLIDLESDEKIKLQPAEIREKYAKEVEAYFQKIKNKCTDYQIDFVLADINKNYEQILLEYMIKRSKLY